MPVGHTPVHYVKDTNPNHQRLANKSRKKKIPRKLTFIFFFLLISPAANSSSSCCSRNSSSLFSGGRFLRCHRTHTHTPKNKYRCQKLVQTPRSPTFSSTLSAFLFTLPFSPARVTEGYITKNIIPLSQNTLHLTPVSSLHSHRCQFSKITVWSRMYT